MRIRGRVWLSWLYPSDQRLLRHSGIPPAYPRSYQESTGIAADLILSSRRQATPIDPEAPGSWLPEVLPEPARTTSLPAVRSIPCSTQVLQRAPAPRRKLPLVACLASSYPGFAETQPEPGSRQSAHTLHSIIAILDIPLALQSAWRPPIPWGFVPSYILSTPIRRRFREHVQHPLSTGDTSITVFARKGWSQH